MVVGRDQTGDQTLAVHAILIGPGPTAPHDIDRNPQLSHPAGPPAVHHDDARGPAVTRVGQNKNYKTLHHRTEPRQDDMLYMHICI